MPPKESYLTREDWDALNTLVLHSAPACEVMERLKPQPTTDELAQAFLAFPNTATIGELWDRLHEIGLIGWRYRGVILGGCYAYGVKAIAVRPA